MCAIYGFLGNLSEPHVTLKRMSESLFHRGPDHQDLYVREKVGLGHNRLAVIGLSPLGNQPMILQNDSLVITFNGEIFNYKEIRYELGEKNFKTETDTEVLLKAFEEWGLACLERLIGMFAFAIWDKKKQELFCARDRFGIKPFYYTRNSNCFVFSSEPKGLFAAGIPRENNEEVWSTYLSSGVYDHSEKTFFKNVLQLSGGQYMIVTRDGAIKKNTYYDLSLAKPEQEDVKCVTNQIIEEYSALLESAVALSCRSDVPIGISLSSGLDSSVLLQLMNALHLDEKLISAFTYTCGQGPYDESRLVRETLSKYQYPWHLTELKASQFPALIDEVTKYQEEPFGGFNTVCLSELCMNAKKNNITVLLDGNGMDEQWAGYEYYEKKNWSHEEYNSGPVQSSKSSTVRTNCLSKDFLKYAEALEFPKPFDSMLDNLRYRDLVFTKIPRALRFSDRASMMHSRELRIPFLDHRLVEYSFRINNALLISDNEQKFLLKKMMYKKLPSSIVLANKKPLHTPQREWLAGVLSDYVDDLLRDKKFKELGWFDYKTLIKEWEHFKKSEADNSFFVWQWISASLIAA